MAAVCVVRPKQAVPEFNLHLTCVKGETKLKGLLKKWEGTQTTAAGTLHQAESFPVMVSVQSLAHHKLNNK